MQKKIEAFQEFALDNTHQIMGGELTFDSSPTQKNIIYPNGDVIENTYGGPEGVKNDGIGGGTNCKPVDPGAGGIG